MHACMMSLLFQILMKTIAVLSRKGGSAKTTTTVNLAVAAQLAGENVAIIDLDEQGSATTWQSLHGADAPTVIPATEKQLQDLLNAAQANGADLVLIDTPPHSKHLAVSAAKAADLVLIPCRPTLADLAAITSSVEICKLAKAKSIGVLTACRVRSPLTRQAEHAMADAGLELPSVHIGDRVAYIHAFTQGKGVLETHPHEKAATEIRKLYAYIHACVH